MHGSDERARRDLNHASPQRRDERSAALPQDTRAGKTGVSLPPVTKTIAPAAAPGGASAPRAPVRKRPRLSALGTIGRPPRSAPDRPVVGPVRPVALGAGRGGGHPGLVPQPGGAAEGAPDAAGAGPGLPQMGLPQPGEAVEVRAREAGYLGGWLRARVLQV